MPAETSRHPGYLVSVACGVLGALLLLVGVLIGNDGVAIAGFVAGSVSLVAALVWRAELVATWRSTHRRPPTA